MESQGFRWNVRVRPGHADRATVYVRTHQIEIGAPLQFDQEYAGVTALEHVLGAIGADLVNGLRTVARRRRVEIEDVEAVVEGALNNPLTHIGVVGEEGHPGLERIGVRVYVRSLAPEEQVRWVWDEALAKSPLACTFRTAVDLDLSVHVAV